MNPFHVKECIGNSRIGHEHFSLVESIEISMGHDITLRSKRTKMIFVLEGSLLYSLGRSTNCVLEKDYSLLIPAHYIFDAKACEKSQIISISIDPYLQKSGCLFLKKINNSNKKSGKYEPYTLHVNKFLAAYLDLLKFYISEGLKSDYILDIKIKELFCILSGFYREEELFNFFGYLLNEDTEFSQQIYQSYHMAKNAKELAEILNYSYSGFVKRFRRVFGVPVYHWMKEQKAQSIYYEINNSNKSFNEISSEYGFSSQARFSDFCRSEFNIPPREIRKKNIKRQ